MSARSLAALLLLSAGVLYVAVAIPLRKQAVSLGNEYKRLRESRRQAQERLVVVEQRMAERARAASILARAASSPGDDPLTELRADVLATLEGRPVTNVRLQVRPARAPLAASFRLEATGRFEEIVELSGRLVTPASRVILERATFRTTPSGLVLDLEGARPGVAR